MANRILTYLPARLVKTSTRWYIIFYQVSPTSDERIRIRETYDLNRIKGIWEREQHAKALIKEINSKLPSGWPFEPSQKVEIISIIDALQLALDVRCQTDRQRTIDNYNSIHRKLKAFVTDRKLGNSPIAAFSRRIAIEYMDTQTKLGIRNRTWNNIKEATNSLFAVLVDREYIIKNPFSGIQPKTEETKTRRKLTDQEAAAILTYSYEHHRRLFYAIILQYYCYIRPAELRRLRLSDINIAKGIITISEAQAKPKHARTVTIPTEIINLLAAPDFISHPANYLIFGERMNPHATKSCGANTFNFAHLVILEKLTADGIINDHTGLSFYSWKDTGITNALQVLPIIAVMTQAGHSSPDMTMKYYHRPDKSEEYANYQAPSEMKKALHPK